MLTTDFPRSIFNVEQVPPDLESTLFQFYRDKEIDVLKNHFFESDLQDQEKLLCQWRSFKFELIELRKKWLHFKDQVTANKLKLKYTSTEWVLCGNNKNSSCCTSLKCMARTFFKIRKYLLKFLDVTFSHTMDNKING